MRLSLSTWNSQSINNNAPYYSAILPAQLVNLSKNPILVNRSGDYPHLSGVVKNSKVLVINVIIAAGYDNNTYRETLKRYFFADDNSHTLVAIDKNDSDRQYYVTGIPTLLVQESDTRLNSFFITITLDYPYWQQVTATADSWDITATGDSDIVNNVGNMNVAPVFTITPLTTKTKGLKYRKFVSVYNNLDKSYVEPLDLTNGGLDAQSLINTGKMQSGGIDFRIWNDGSFADVWTAGMDSDSDPGLAWANYSLSPRKYSNTLSVFDSDDTTLSFTQTRASLRFLQFLKVSASNILQIDSDSDNNLEMVTFSSSDVDLINYQISSISRGQKDTTAVPHLANALVKYIEHDTWMLYGDSDLSSQDVDSDFQPLLNLSTSTNNQWSWSNFYDMDSNRTAGWLPEVQSSRTGLSYNYTQTENTFVDPSTTLGLALVGSPDFQVQNESGTLDWTFSNPAGITSIAYTGEKYMTDSWPAIAGLQALQPNTVWFTIQNEVAPTVNYSWEVIDNSTGVSLGDTYETIRFAIDGLLSSAISAAALIEFTPSSISLDSDNTPSFNIGGETSVNFFDVKLTNNTTGEYIKFQVPCLVNQSVTIDCANKEAYLSDGSRVNVTLSSDRNEWLDLQPGNNSLQYDDTGTVHVNVVITHRDRNL